AELDAAALRELAAVASSMHMTTVIEVAGAAALRAAMELHTACIGIAGTGSDGRADLARVREVAEQVPRQRTVLLLDEVAARDDLLPLVGVIDAAVVGDALLAAPDPAAAIAAFLTRAG